MDPRIAAIEKEYIRTDLPAFSPGDTVRVGVRIREGGKERIQPFEGICIGRRGAGVNATFTLRRVSGEVGVERIFPAHSPWIAGLEVVRRGDVRRAKLYYLRARKGRSARVRERRWWLDKPAAQEAAGEAATETAPETVDPIEEAAEMAVEATDTVEAPAVEAPDAGAEAEAAVEDAAEEVVEEAQEEVSSAQ